VDNCAKPVEAFEFSDSKNHDPHCDRLFERVGIVENLISFTSGDKIRFWLNGAVFRGWTQATAET